MVNPDEIRELLAAHHEWLLVRETGRTFPLTNPEIEITADGDKTLIGFIGDDGFHDWRLHSFESDGSELSLRLSREFGKRETIRLVPRIAASTLTAEVELARLEKANEIASLIKANFPGIKLGRVALNTDGGRVAQILFDDADKTPVAATYDVTGKLTVEVVLSSAILWLEKLGSRKKQVLDIWIVCEKRHAKNLQKLHALLTDRWKAKITIFEIKRKTEPPVLAELPKRKIRDLWREKSRRPTAQELNLPGGIAQRIIDISPDEIDVVYSRQGETLRFMGLPFARVRTMMGIEKAWFGVGRDRRILTDETWEDLVEIVEQLKLYRTAETLNKRHEYYRTAPEAWLESILRRNITLLDANLILSPIYHQFRSSNDKIDLLALRKDGRLVIIELKTQPDRSSVFQAADYWRKIELQRRRGLLDEADLFDGRTIANQPAIIYLAAPAWSFHRNFEFFAKTISTEIELWRFELHENWREQVRVVAREDYRE
ncbi:MAG: hypothetical protein ABL952_13885 [Pyrinomonadaceae bacterium]